MKYLVQAAENASSGPRTTKRRRWRAAGCRRSRRVRDARARAAGTETAHDTRRLPDGHQGVCRRRSRAGIYGRARVLCAAGGSSRPSGAVAARPFRYPARSCTRRRHSRTAPRALPRAADPAVLIEALRARGAMLVDLGRRGGHDPPRAGQRPLRSGTPSRYIALGGHDPKVMSECDSRGPTGRSANRTGPWRARARHVVRGRRLHAGKPGARRALRGQHSPTARRSVTLPGTRPRPASPSPKSTGWSCGSRSATSIWAGRSPSRVEAAEAGSRSSSAGSSAYEATGAQPVERLLARPAGTGAGPRRQNRGRPEHCGAGADARPTDGRAGVHDGAAPRQGRTVEDAPWRSSSAYRRNLRSSLMMNSFGSGCPPGCGPCRTGSVTKTSP